MSAQVNTEDHSLLGARVFWSQKLIEKLKIIINELLEVLWRQAREISMEDSHIFINFSSRIFIRFSQ